METDRQGIKKHARLFFVHFGNCADEREQDYEAFNPAKSPMKSGVSPRVRDR